MCDLCIASQLDVDFYVGCTVLFLHTCTASLAYHPYCITQLLSDQQHIYLSYHILWESTERKIYNIHGPCTSWNSWYFSHFFLNKVILFLVIVIYLLTNLILILYYFRVPTPLEISKFPTISQFFISPSPTKATLFSQLFRSKISNFYLFSKMSKLFLWSFSWLRLSMA